MEQKYSESEDFDFEVVTEGSFIDEGYNIRTIVIRLNGVALREWFDSVKHSEEKDPMRKSWEKKILEKLNFEKAEGYCITRTVSELFTVVIFTSSI